MGLFDGILGGLIGAEMATAVNHLIAEHGGVNGIVAQLQQGGLGEAVRSWVGTGANAAVSPAQVHTALGPEMMQQLAAKTGLSTDALAQKLSEILPQVVDKLTPGGVVPKS
jgi:uncharacterized protein YidB (DUF937 family)